MSLSNSPLGKDTDYPTHYDPDLLHPIARADSRERFAGAPLPFFGCDIWNAWELTWLDDKGLPQVATLEIRVPADTSNLVESKSLKLYLNSFAMTRFDGAAKVAATIRDDLSECAGGPVSVRLDNLSVSETGSATTFPGSCLDSLDVNCDTYDVDVDLLHADDTVIVDEALYSHLLRSLCPVTAQPDIGSIGIRYSGPKIDPASLLKYLVSYREHNDFHEACVETIFADILERCGSTRLSVYARYQRRGGLDINPFRSTIDEDGDNFRLWRQ